MVTYPTQSWLSSMVLAHGRPDMTRPERPIVPRLRVGDRRARLVILGDIDQTCQTVTPMRSFLGYLRSGAGAAADLRNWPISILGVSPSDCHHGWLHDRERVALNRESHIGLFARHDTCGLSLVSTWLVGQKKWPIIFQANRDRVDLGAWLEWVGQNGTGHHAACRGAQLLLTARC